MLQAQFLELINFLDQYFSSEKNKEKIVGFECENFNLKLEASVAGIASCLMILNKFEIFCYVPI